MLPQECSRIIFLKQSNIIFDGSLEEALNEEILSRLYDAKVKIFKNGCGIVIRARSQC